MVKRVGFSCVSRWLLVASMVLMLASSSGFAQQLRVLSTASEAPFLDHVHNVIIPAYKEAYGLDISFEVTTWDERNDKLLVSIASGVPYDVVFTGFFSPYEEGGRGLLAPLNRYLEAWEHYEKYPSELWETQKWQGDIFAVPHDVQLRVIGYNKELFAQAGIGTDQTPQSWEEFTQYTQLLTRLQGDEAVSQRGFGLWWSGAAAGQTLFWWMRQAGLTELNEDMTESMLNHPMAQEALSALIDVYDAAMIGLPGGDGGLPGGALAMTTMAPQVYRTAVLDNPDLYGTIGAFALRRSPEYAPVSHAFVNGVAILEASEQKDEGWRFIEMLMDDESLMAIQLSTGWLMGRSDLAQEYAEVVPGIDMYFDLIQYMQASVIPPPRNVAQQEVAALVTQAYEREISPQEALLQGHELWGHLLREWQDDR